MLKNFDFVDRLVSKAQELIDSGFERDEDLRVLSHLTDVAVKSNNPFIAYAYARRISPILPDNENVKKSFALNNLQNMVLFCSDDELKYLFARDVVGADVEKFARFLPKGSFERRQLEKDLEPLG